jgi:DNA replication protein DnaD
LEQINRIAFISKSLKVCVLADQNFKYSDEILNYWATEINSDYPKLEQEKLKEIIKNGSKGVYGKYYSINLSTVYDWIKTAVPKKMVY